MHESILDLREKWLATKAELSARTLSTYSGEVARFEEFCRDRGVRRAEQLSTALWDAYLTELRAGRSGTRSKRVETLTEGSARQAHRITRAFLSWLFEEGRIGWCVPRTTAAVLTVEEAKAHSNDGRESGSFVLHRLQLPSILTRNMAANAPESELRRQVAVNLVFWAALKPAEVVSLPVEGLSKARRGLTRVQLQGTALPRFAPAHLWQAWLRYRHVRESRCGCSLKPHEPLLCTLNGAEALTPWTIWSIVRSLDVDFASSPRELRLEYLRRLTRDAADGLKAARDVCGLPNLQPHMNAFVSRASDARINEVLLRAAG
jgi:site-specific recombinase XerD